MIDRVAPSVRPTGRNAGTQRWESLLFCHWEVPIDSLRPLIPEKLEIDTFDGKAFVGVVPFHMRKIRPSWLPRFLTFDFLETNVRTYVIHKGKPGVYFFSLDANFPPAVWVARAGWSLPYQHAQMSSSEANGIFTYESKRRGTGVAHRSVCHVGESLGTSELGSLEHFLLERYLLFVEHRNQIYSGTVNHVPYPAYSCTVTECDDQLVAASGLPPCATPPEITHFSPGVDVEVFAIQPVE